MDRGGNRVSFMARRGVIAGCGTGLPPARPPDPDPYSRGAATQRENRGNRAWPLIQIQWSTAR